MPNVDTSKKFDSVEKYRIRKLLSELADKTGRGTELVSLYLPPKKAIHEAIAALREESGTASNIKSDVTRNHVQDALTKTMARLRLYKQTPENGLVIFCGAIPGPGGPGNETIELFEVIPQKPVTTYLYRCLAPETMILLDDNSQAPIKSLAGQRGQNVWTYDIDQKNLSKAPIEKHVETLSGDRKVYRLTVESGRSITATEDHPFFTPKGWISLGELKAGDLTCVNPSFEDATISQTVEDDYVILDESHIRKMEAAPANLDLTVRRLKQRGLLPLCMSNPKLYPLSRLIGHLFSDGSLIHSKESRNGKPCSHFTVDYCLGGVADYESLRIDLSKLGVKTQKAYKSHHVVCKDGRTATTSTLRVKMRDTAFCTLLRALGAPVGSKVRNCPPLPSWLFRAPTGVQREFLASYMGGDGEAPRILKSNPCGAKHLAFHRIKEKRESGLEFAAGIRQLFSNFGVIVNEITCVPGCVHKDDSETLEIELRFNLSQSNVLKICHSIGYRYCKRKSDQANRVGEYLRIRKFLSEGTLKKMNRPRAMNTNGSTLIEISSTLGLLMFTAKQCSIGSVVNPLVRSTSLPEYDDWLELARANLGGGLLWESIMSKEEVQMENVMDVTIGNESHNFFANGFLVHNCDDHFHLEPLREMLREQNVIGILSMDSTEAGLGIVSGDSWEVIDTMTSGVSGKTRKGGQCVSEDTLVQLDDGKLVPISEIARGSKVLSYEFKNYTSGIFECADIYSMTPKDYYEINTSRPQMKIRATGEHRFFTVGPRGVCTIQAHKLKTGDRLLLFSGSEGDVTRLSQLQETGSNLQMIAKCDLVLGYVSKVERKTNTLSMRFVDIEIPITRSFIGNGFVLHNSARRYERLREMELTDYFNRLADHAKKAFLEQYQIKGLIVSGPGPTKDEFVRDKYLDYRLQNFIVGTLDSGYAGREGVRETIEKAGKLLENVRVMEEKKLVQRFFGELNSDSGLAIYGVTDILANLKKAAVDTIIINDDVETIYLKATCNKCGNVTERFVPRSQIVAERQKLLTCPKCGSNEIEITQRDIVDYLADAAIDSGANVEVISSKTEDGAMMKNFGGISAILRYRA
jgi:peptide subunit release factor 1 (eRF1)/intein/homing endonuclease